MYFSGMINGAVAGLVCITPAAGYVDMTGAFFIGFFGGPLCYGGAQLKHYLGTLMHTLCFIFILCTSLILNIT